MKHFSRRSRIAVKKRCWGSWDLSVSGCTMEPVGQSEGGLRTQPRPRYRENWGWSEIKLGWRLDDILFNFDSYDSSLTILCFYFCNKDICFQVWGSMSPSSALWTSRHQGKWLLGRRVQYIVIFYCNFETFVSSPEQRRDWVATSINAEGSQQHFYHSVSEDIPLLGSMLSSSSFLISNELSSQISGAELYLLPIDGSLHPISW